MMRVPHFTKTEWAPLMGAMIILVFLLSGCWERPSPSRIVESITALGVPASTVGKSATTLIHAKDIPQAKADAEEARAQLAFWKARLDVSLDRERRLIAEERQHWLEMACRWLMGMCIFGMIASGCAFAASFIWPWFERLRYAAIAGVGAAVAIFCIAWYLPSQIFWIGVAIALCTVAGVIVLFLHSHSLGNVIKRKGGP